MDGDGMGDARDEDINGDGVLNGEDKCSTTINPTQADRDGDGFGDACDFCPDDPNKRLPGGCGCGIRKDVPCQAGVGGGVGVERGVSGQCNVP